MKTAIAVMCLLAGIVIGGLFSGGGQSSVQAGPATTEGGGSYVITSSEDGKELYVWSPSVFHTEDAREVSVTRFLWRTDSYDTATLKKHDEGGNADEDESSD